MCASRMYASCIITRITACKRVNIARSRATYRMFPVLNFVGISCETYVSFVRYCMSRLTVASWVAMVSLKSLPIAIEDTLLTCFSWLME